MRWWRVGVYRFPMAAPDDTAAIERAMAAGELDPATVVAILGKTEGNGCVNDFTRALATRAVADSIAARLGVSAEAFLRRTAVVMSGGTEGVLSPHVTVFTREDAGAEPATPGNGRLAIGIERTPDYLPEEIGTAAQARAVRDAVRRAVAAAGIEGPGDVHFVQTKCPLLTTERIAAARGRGADTVTADTYRSMAFSRGASALGVALALGEVEEGALADAAILRDLHLHSAVASTSAGVEVLHDVVFVLGNSPYAAGDLVIGHDLMRDCLDGDAVRRALERGGAPHPLPPGRLRAVLAKAEADPTGRVHGRRHTMLTDSDIPPTRMARAVVGAVLAAAVGDPMLYVSGGAEHQGPPGGGPLAVIWQVWPATLPAASAADPPGCAGPGQPLLAGVERGCTLPGG